MKPLKTLALSVAAVMIAIPAIAAPQIGAPAPDFTAVDTHGKEVKLSDLEGKNVILEWTNHKCPFVIKHYDSGNMQQVQKAVADEDTVWISVVSSAPGKQGHVSAAQANEIVTEAGATPTYKILDESGEIGKMFDAKTTPHLFIVGKDGNLAYNGAIDSNSSPRQSAIEGATNYITTAMANIDAGKAPDPAQTQPYGCSVKY